MYLHLGQDTIICTRNILGVFDIDTTTISRSTRNFLAVGEQRGEVINVTQELPKSFIVTVEATKKRQCKKKQSIYISQISASTLKKRSGYIEYIRNI